MTDSQTKELGRLLREERERRGWNQRKSADYFEVSNPTVSAWERGDSIPAFDALMVDRMIVFLGVDADELARILLKSIVAWQERRARS